MKYTLSLLLVLAGLLTTHAQSAEQLKGKWKFEDAYKKETLDSAGIKMLHRFFGSMTLYFKANGHYKALFMGKTEEGNWNLQADKRSVTLTSNTGQINTINIIELTDKQLIISLDQASFIMSRTEPTAADETEETAKPATSYVSATLKQVTKKWLLKRRELPNRTEEQIELMSKLAEGTYFDFKENGSYEVEVLGIKENGTWSFSNNNTAIITAAEDNKKVWNIISISDTELVLAGGRPGEKWTFRTK